jgi:hypothetical protein
VNAFLSKHHKKILAKRIAKWTKTALWQGKIEGFGFKIKGNCPDLYKLTIK